MKIKKAFTLAEVLITLAILGVVAALTLPVLFENIDNRVLESQYKKARAVLANGIKMLTAQTGGSVYLKDTQLKRCGDDRECIAAEMKKVFKVVEDNISSNSSFDTTYIFRDGEEEPAIWQDPIFDYVFSTADGMTFGIMKNADNRNNLVVIADINGVKNPNTAEEDLCSYVFDDTAQLLVSTSGCTMDTSLAAQCSEDNLSACDQAQCNALVSSSAECRYQYYYTLCKQGDPNCKPGVCQQVCKWSK